MTETSGTPAYQRLANSLRSQIAEGALPVGSAIPSASQLVTEHKVSTTVVREALKVLSHEGLIYGQPGKGVYVLATPEQAQSERLTLEEVTAGLSELREQVADLEPSTDVAALDDLRSEIAEIRRAMAVLQSQLIDLYGRVGQPYPRDKAPIKGDSAPERSRRAVGD